MTTYIECTPEEVGKLINQIRKLKTALGHVMYRTHPHSPKSCSACEAVEEVTQAEEPCQIKMRGE